MKINIKFSVLLIMAIITFSVSAYGQAINPKEKYTLSGIVANRTNNESLIGTTVYIPEAKASCVTNAYGFYSITLPKGEYTVMITAVGFNPLSQKISLHENTKMDLTLPELTTELEAVVISANNNKANISKAEMSVNKLSVSTIKKMPAVLGEVDVLRAILQLPGVSTAQEGASGFNVRGGSVDGNLVLLDEAVVYNTSHLFGFFSVFNADVIKDIKLYKGGIPANFGGRASSVLDIYQKEGDSKDFHVNGGIGLVSSRLLVEGPIVKEKSSFVVAARGSYAHLFLKLASNPNTAYFYDINSKLKFKLNDNNTLFLSGYIGNDNINFNDNFINTYGNSVVNLRWNHNFSEKLFSNASLIYSDYNYGLKLKVLGLDWNSDIKNYNFKYDFKDYVSDKLTLSFGLNTMYYRFNPGTIRPLGENSAVNPRQIDKKFGLENALYISAEQKLNDRLSLSYGLRYSNFLRLGKQELNTYADNIPVIYNPELNIYEEAQSTGTIRYGQNEKIASFNNLEPRAALAYSFDDNQSIKASYNRMSQYVHLVSNTTSVSPLDIWAPSDQYMKPEIADQFALGYFKNFKDDTYSLETEAFYKNIKNKADYIDGADLLANEAIERLLLNGQARAYGLEVMLKKNKGRLNGWISYTLSRSQQRTPGRTGAEPGINNGNWYRASYDKLHNLSVTTAYEINKAWTFGGIFTYQSGRAATFPNGKYEFDGISVATYGARNAGKLSAYHHLDISLTYKPKSGSERRWKSEWVFSVYNVYNRQNAAAYSFRQDESTGNNVAYRSSIFGVMPGVTYNFKF